MNKIELNISETQDLDVIRRIITNPLVLKKSQDPTVTRENFKLQDDYKYLIVKDQYSNHLGCFVIKELTKIVLDTHLYILPKYWGTGLSLEVSKTFHHWAKQKGYLQIFTKIPANCIWSIKYMQKLNYVCCGMLQKGIIIDNMITPLFFYTCEI